MKKNTIKAAFFPLLLALLLAACVPTALPIPSESLPGDASISEEESLSEPEAGADIPEVYTLPEDGLTPEETVQVFLEQMYLSYLHFVDIDLTAILDTNFPEIENYILWSKKLNQRRRLLRELDLCYVETERLPYSIRFIEPDELTDQRLEFWDAHELTKVGEVLLHFVVEGEEGAAYPPFLPTGAQHTVRLTERKGVWKISFHYFPGSRRLYLHRDGLDPRSDEEISQELKVEFGYLSLNGEVPGQEDPPVIPTGAALYNGERAAEYARQYTESANPAFYNVGDWLGDCANFTSQCIWYGFGASGENPVYSGSERMTGSWYAGAGGGSPAWENVEYFWQEITSGGALGGQQLGTVFDLEPGDLIQTSSPGFEQINGRDRYSHSLVVVDKDTLLLGQHSPGCFMYYADLTNVSTRFIRPVYVHG